MELGGCEPEQLFGRAAVRLVLSAEVPEEPAMTLVEGGDLLVRERGHILVLVVLRRSNRSKHAVCGV